MFRCCLFIALVFALIAPGASAKEAPQTDTVWNMTKHRYEDAPVRLKVDVSGLDREKLVVTAEGEPVPHQVDEAGRVWVMVTLGAGEARRFEVKQRGEREGRESPAITIPEEVANALALKPLPSSGARSPGQYEFVKGPLWAESIERTLADASTTEDPSPGATRRMRYWRGKPYLVIHEDRDAGEGAMNQTAQLPPTDWQPTHAVMRRWFKKPFEGSGGLEKFPLDPAALEGVSRDADNNVAVELLPRWTQSPDQGWFFGVTDGERMVGVMPIRASEWRWPHESRITARIPEKGKPELVFPTAKGARTWLLIAGPATLLDKLDEIALETSHASLDKLHNEYVWGSEPARPEPGSAATGGQDAGRGADRGREGPARLISTQDFFSNATNPTAGLRQEGRGLVKQALSGKVRNDLQTVYDAQATFDADWYGRYEDGWSPINPNFYTDFLKPGIARTAMLREHPAFEHLRAQAEAAFGRDVAYSVTLPGGAGQECPGYQEHAMNQWRELVPLCADYLKFDPRMWERYQAGAAFEVHVSVPDGPGQPRQFHPAGDTHPGKPDPAGWAKEFGVESEISNLKSEELPGFGVVFRSQPGTNDETFLSFKAGPNRGHYHGDQLSLHYAAGATPLAIDHRVSYSPRAGQEHVHNRVSFSLPNDPTFKFANMDGYERLIAFQKSEGGVAEVAVAQVSSPRLRAVKEFPPEEWDDDRTLHTFEGGELTYRRTVVHVLPEKEGGRDYFVIRDQWEAPEPVKATFNLHVLGDKMEREGNVIRFDGMTLFVSQPAEIELVSWPSTTATWLTPEKKGESTQGARLSQTGTSGEFVTVMYPGEGKDVPKFAPIRGAGSGIEIGEATRVAFDLGLVDRTSHVKMTEQRFPVVMSSPAGKFVLSLEDIDLTRSQGRVGLFVPDVGYPFGPIPQWLLEQRAGVTGEDVGTGGAGAGND